MERTKLKSALWVITYTVGLVLVAIRIEDILHGAGIFIGLLTPLLLGIVLAFVLDRPYEHLRGWYRRRWKLGDRGAKIWAIVSVYALALGAVAVLIGIVAPEVLRNLMTFAANADSYLLVVQNGVNAFTDESGLSRIDLSGLIALVDSYLGGVTEAISGLLPQIMEVTTGLVSALAAFFLALVMSIYIMSGKERLLSQIKRCLRVYLPPKFLCPLWNFMSTVYQVFDSYVAGQCKEAVILGLLSGHDRAAPGLRRHNQRGGGGYRPGSHSGRLHRRGGGGHPAAFCLTGQGAGFSHIPHRPPTGGGQCDLSPGGGP